MKDIRRRSNPTINLSKFTFNEKIWGKLAKKYTVLYSRKTLFLQTIIKHFTGMQRWHGAIGKQVAEQKKIQQAQVLMIFIQKMKSNHHVVSWNTFIELLASGSSQQV